MQASGTVAACMQPLDVAAAASTQALGAAAASKQALGAAATCMQASGAAAASMQALGAVAAAGMQASGAAAGDYARGDAGGRSVDEASHAGAVLQRVQLPGATLLPGSGAAPSTDGRTAAAGAPRHGIVSQAAAAASPMVRPPAAPADGGAMVAPAVAAASSREAPLGATDRKKRIHSLLQDGVTVEGHEQLKSYITSYYKGLFGSPEESDITLDESRVDDIAQVTPQENAVLTAPYTKEEIRKAVFQMELNKAPGPDGFPAEFFQTFWDTIKKDLLELFEELQPGN
nr:uncharacterized protein LOC127328385 [Lolium perenne]